MYHPTTPWKCRAYQLLKPHLSLFQLCKIQHMHPALPRALHPTRLPLPKHRTAACADLDPVHGRWWMSHSPRPRPGEVTAVTLLSCAGEIGPPVGSHRPLFMFYIELSNTNNVVHQFCPFQQPRFAVGSVTAELHFAHATTAHWQWAVLRECSVVCSEITKYSTGNHN